MLLEQKSWPASKIFFWLFTFEIAAEILNPGVHVINRRKKLRCVLGIKKVL